MKAFGTTLLGALPTDNDKSSEIPRYSDREFIIVIGNNNDEELIRKIGRTNTDGLDSDCDNLIIRGGKQTPRGVNITYDSATLL
jgi:hypothetical protein